MVFLFSCASKNEEKEKLNESQEDENYFCDTTLEFVIDLIENQDSVWAAPNVKVARNFKYPFKLKNGETRTITSPFLNKFHDSLSLTTLKKNQLDTLFNIESIDYKYGELSFNVDCAEKYRFITLDSVKIMKNRDDNDILDERFMYYSFSYPLKTEDGNFLLIEMDSHCGGLCGDGVTFIFEKDSESWILKFTLTRWVS